MKELKYYKMTNKNLQLLTVLAIIVGTVYLIFFCGASSLSWIIAFILISIIKEC